MPTAINMNQALPIDVLNYYNDLKSRGFTEYAHIVAGAFVITKELEIELAEKEAELAAVSAKYKDQPTSLEPNQEILNKKKEVKEVEQKLNKWQEYSNSTTLKDAKETRRNNFIERIATRFKQASFLGSSNFGKLLTALFLPVIAIIEAFSVGEYKDKNFAGRAFERGRMIENESELVNTLQAKDKQLSEAQGKIGQLEQDRSKLVHRGKTLENNLHNVVGQANGIIRQQKQQLEQQVTESRHREEQARKEYEKREERIRNNVKDTVENFFSVIEEQGEMLNSIDKQEVRRQALFENRENSSEKASDQNISKEENKNKTSAERNIKDNIPPVPPTPKVPVHPKPKSKTSFKDQLVAQKDKIMGGNKPAQNQPEKEENKSKTTLQRPTLMKVSNNSTNSNEVGSETQKASQKS